MLTAELVMRGVCTMLVRPVKVWLDVVFRSVTLKDRSSLRACVSYIGILRCRVSWRWSGG